MVDDFNMLNEKKIKGTIVGKLSIVMFGVEIPPSKIWKRHISQIIRCVDNFEIDNACTNGKKTIDDTTILRRSERLKVCSDVKGRKS